MSLRVLSRNAGIIGGGLLVSRLLAFVREALLARKFGLTGSMDALVVALGISDFAVNLLLGGAAATVLLPALSHAHQRGQDGDFWRLARMLQQRLSPLLVAMAALVFFLSRQITAWTAPGLPAPTATLAASLVRIVAISIAFAGGALAYTSMLQARERFLLPSTATIFQNAIVVAAILVFARSLSVTIVALAVVAGAVGRNLILRRGVAKEGLTVKWQRLPLSPEASRVLADFLPATIAFSVIYLNAFIDRYYASTLAAGTITAINYADKLTQVPLAVLGSAVSIAIIPVFTRHLREQRLDRLRRDLGWSLAATMSLAALIAFAVISLRLRVIDLLFGRGHLNATGITTAAIALLFYSLTIVPEIGGMLLMRVFHAQRDVWTPALVTVGALGLHVSIAAWLTPRLGVEGIGTAIVTSSVIFLIVLAGLVWFRLFKSSSRPVAA